MQILHEREKCLKCFYSWCYFTLNDESERSVDVNDFFLLRCSTRGVLACMDDLKKKVQSFAFGRVFFLMAWTNRVFHLMKCSTHSTSMAINFLLSQFTLRS